MNIAVEKISIVMVITVCVNMTGLKDAQIASKQIISGCFCEGVSRTD